MSTEDIKYLCCSIENMDINDRKVASMKYKKNILWAIIQLLHERRDPYIRSFIRKALNLNYNDIRVIVEGCTNPLFELKIEKVYNLFIACAATKQQAIYKTIYKLLSRKISTRA